MTLIVSDRDDKDFCIYDATYVKVCDLDGKVYIKINYEDDESYHFICKSSKLKIKNDATGEKYSLSQFIYESIERGFSSESQWCRIDIYKLRQYIKKNSVDKNDCLKNEGGG